MTRIEVARTVVAILTVLALGLVLFFVVEGVRLFWEVLV